MSRRRFQRGHLFLRGKCKVWVGQWREDMDMGEDKPPRRLIMKRVIGTHREFPTERLARRRFDIILAHVNSPNYKAAKTIVFDCFLPMYRERVLKLHKPSSARAAESHLGCHLLPRFSEHRLDMIDQEAVQRFIASLSPKLSRHTIANVLGTLISVLRTAKRWGYLVGELFPGELVFPSGGPRQAGRHFTADQARAIIQAAQEPWRTMFALAAMTGLRAGELLGLQVTDLDFERAEIHVRRSAWYGRAQAPKSKASVRTIPMPSVLAGMLRAYLGTWRPNAQGWLFTTRNSRPPSSNKVVEMRLWPLLDGLGIPRCGLHAFRHTASSLLIAEGAPATVAQAQLGHSDPHTTLGIYSHVVESQQRRFAERLADILMPSDTMPAPCCVLIQ